MSGTVTPFLDFKNSTDSGLNDTAAIQPIVNGEQIHQTTLQRPDENLRQRTEAIRSFAADSLFLHNADRAFLTVGPGAVTWPGSTTASLSGIPVLSDVLWILPMLTPGSAQTQPIPPVASAYGTLHLKRASDSADAILVTSMRRSYAAGDQINIEVSAGGSFACTLQTEVAGAYRRTIKIVATPTTTLGTVITALNGITPPSPDNTQLVTAALEGGATNSDYILDTQARQFVAGNYDGEGHTITPSNLASFFTSNPTQALAEGDTLCVQYTMLTDTASTGGRRQAIPENSNTTIPAASFFNSRVHPDRLVNALPVCKVVNGSLVFATGVEIQAGATAVPLSIRSSASLSYAGGGTWADGTTNPATTVEGQLDKVITDLAGTAGGAKIGGAVVGTDLAADTLNAQIAAIAAGWGKLARTNTWTLNNTFQKSVVAGSGLLSTAADARTSRFFSSYSVTHAYTLIWQSDPDSGAVTVQRKYVSSSGDVVLTANAWFDGTNWNKDAAGTNAMMWMFKTGSIETYARVADAAWTTWTKVNKTSVAQTVTATNPNFAPMLEHFDSANNRRVAVDHLGNPGGYRFEIRQNWLFTATTDTEDGWTRSITGSGTFAADYLTSGIPAVRMQVGSGAGTATASTTRGQMFSSLGSGFPKTNQLVSMEFAIDAATLTGSSPGATFEAGFRNGSPGVFFRKFDGVANWQFCYQGISTPVPADTGVAATGEHLFRIDAYGASHPGGARTIAYIDGVLVAEVVASVAGLDYPTTGAWPQFELTQTSAGSAVGPKVGPVVLAVRPYVGDYAY